MTAKRTPRPPRDHAELVLQLRGAGLRRTAPRVAVLERLAQAAAPRSHGQLADELDGLGFDRATVYRNLMDLTQAGLVRRADLGDHVWRFSLVRAGETEHARKHPHLLCTDCGTVQCLPDVKVKITPARSSRVQLHAAALEVQLKGLCERCDR
jgi:Fur family transcriptional regulator, ferric uptake regulator